MFAFAIAEPRSAALATLPSTLFHAALVTGALWATRPFREIFPDPGPTIDISWVAPVPTSTSHSSLPSSPLIPTFNDPAIAVPEIPVIDPSLPGTPSVDPRTLIPGAPPTTGYDTNRTYLGSASTIYQESEIDEPPVLLSSAAPRYPRVLAEAGIDGRVTLSFVIDTDGRVVAGSARAEQATHPAFVPAAEEAVYASRFRPAHRRGEAVAVRVRQAVVFRH